MGDPSQSYFYANHVLNLSQLTIVFDSPQFTDKMSKSQTPNGHNVERQNVEWDTMPNAKMSNETKCRTDKISNGTKCRRDKMSKVI
jgi:hypothetical protein